MNKLPQICRSSCTVLIILMTTWAAYFNTLYNGFVYDDAMQVVNNPWIRDIRFLPAIFSNNVWGFHGGEATSNFYRPMMNVILMIDHHLFGLKAWGFHLVNVLLHSANSLMVFRLSVKLFAAAGGGLAPLMASLAFAVHPIHSEAVAWVSGVTDISCSFFFLLSVLFYGRTRQGGGKRESLLSISCFFLAMLCKEPAVVLPFILVAYDHATGGQRGGLFITGRRYLPYVAVLVVFVAVRSWVLGGLTPLKPQQGDDLSVLAMNAPRLFAQYLGKLMLPTKLSAFHTFHPSVSWADAGTIAGIFVTILYLVALVVAYRFAKVIFFGLALVGITIAPALLLPSLGDRVFAERYLYLPSVGFVLLLGVAAARLKENAGKYAPAVTLVLLSILGAFFVQTVRRNAVWKDDMTLYADMAAKASDSEIVLESYASLLLGAGRYHEAIQQLQKIVTKTNPRSERAYFNLGAALQKVGRLEDARAAFRQSLLLDPHGAFTHQKHFNLGVIEYGLGNMNEAIEHFKAALIIQPKDPWYHNLLGNAYSKGGRYEAAIREFEAAMALAPAEASFRSNRDRALMLKRQVLAGGGGQKSRAPVPRPNSSMIGGRDAIR